MPRRSQFVAALTLVGLAFVASGCEGSHNPDPEPIRLTALPSPTAKPAKDELVAALQRLSSKPYKYHAKSNLPEPDRGKVDATGAYDRARKILDETVVMSGGPNAGTEQRRIFGTDSYSRSSEHDTWVHLDFSRVKSKTLVDVNINDATGLAAFINAITTATRTSPQSFRGYFDPSDDKPFMPLGHPCVVLIGPAIAQFTVETNKAGDIISINIELKVKDKPTLNMTTTFSNHGKPLTTKRPPKDQTAEADNFFYS
jgi:hypothetical protein